MLEKTISIIGAGAAGCFAAAVLRDKLSGQASEGNEADGASAGRETVRRNVSIEVYEAGARPLAKVAITGGGRCNLTNTFEGVEDLRKVYPRGANAMRRALGAFSQMDTMRWFESAGVPLTIQPDQCVFPKSRRHGRSDP